ncbi:MAG: hypothetical protein ACRD0P_03470 [Stackebrandtia sp.]
MSMRSIQYSFITAAAITASSVVALGSIEIHALTNGQRLPEPTREWFMWLVATGIAATIGLYLAHMLVRVRSTQRTILDGLRELDRQLDRLDTHRPDLADTIRTEVRGALTDQHINRAVAQAVAPTLQAITDYQNTARRATVTRLPRN